MENIRSFMSFPASRKVYIEGSRKDVRVPMREIVLSPTKTSQGTVENEPVRVYDTTGPYTDPHFEPDVERGRTRRGRGL
ncbi:hypothetical protein AAV833_00460 [Geobacillus stearothermophilus]|uniref:hypothetical protein n=2 Tax=Geobacillus stearothermophilus TaxID=1422 RepID=UPI002E1CBEF6